jgi:hypothetical protein
VGFLGGDPNLYEYGRNDPVNNKDPKGMFLPWTHYHLSYDAAIQAGYPPRIAREFGFWAAKTDFLAGSQETSAASTAIHAMAGIDPLTGEYQTAEQAQMNTQTFIQTKLQLAEMWRNRGECDQYYRAVGAALHAVQDQYSPEHNYAEWHENFSANLDHLISHLFAPKVTKMSALGASALLLSGNIGASIRTW